MRRPYERLLRQLLNYPRYPSGTVLLCVSRELLHWVGCQALMLLCLPTTTFRRPAVILLHSFTWHHLNIPSGLYWASCERDFHEVSFTVSNLCVLHDAAACISAPHPHVCPLTNAVCYLLWPGGAECQEHSVAADERW